MATPAQIAEYNQKWSKAVDDAIAAVDGDGWEEQNVKESDIQVYTRHAQGSSFSQVKSVVTINRPIDAIVDALKTTKVIDENTPKDQREGNIERRIVSTVDGDPDAAGFFYINIEAPSRLISPREFLMYQKLANRDGRMCMVKTSIENDEIRKPGKGNVRANMFFQAFIAEKVDEETTKLTFACHADPCGSIPAMVYNSAATNQGMSALRLKRELEK